MDGDFRRARSLAVAALLVLGAAVTACSAVPDWANPVEWYDTSLGGETRTANEVAPRTAAGDAGFPKVGTVPDRPVVPSSRERQAMQDGLVADRDSARYTDEVLRGRPAAAPPPPAGQRTAAAARPPAPPPAAAPAVAPSPVPDAAPREPVQTAPAPAAQAVDPPAADVPPVTAAVEPPPSVPPAGPAPAAPPPQVAARPVPPAAAPPPQVAARPVAPAAAPPQVAAVAPRPSTAPPMPAPVTEAPRPSPLTEPPRPDAPVPAAEAALTSPAGEPAEDPARIAVIAFPSGGAELNARDERMLGGVLSEHRIRGGIIRVVGHASADARERASSEQKLVNFRVSLRRAEVVAQELIRQGADPRRVFIDARGDAETSPPAGEEMRRAEIFLEN